MVSKVNGTSQVKATEKANEKKKVVKQQQQQFFENKSKQVTEKNVNDSAIKQEVYKKTGFQLKDTKDNGKMITLTVNGKARQYKTVGTLTTGGRILVQDEKGAYHVVSHTKENKLIMLKDDYAKNKIAFETTSKQHKVKYGKKEYVITNAQRDRHGRMTAIDANGKQVILSSKGQELKTGYVEAQDQVDRINDMQNIQNTKKTVFEKSGFQLKDTNNANEKLNVNGKEYTVVGTLTTGGRILVQDEKGAYHVVSRTKENKLTLLNDNYVKKNKNFASSDNYVEQLDKETQSVTDSHASYASKDVMRFKASNGEVWYYNLKTKKYVKYADTEAKAIIRDLDDSANGLGTNYTKLKQANDNIIDPEVLKRINKNFEAEYGSDVKADAKYGDGNYKTAYEAFLASEIGDDEVYLFNASLVKNGAILDQSRRNEILQTNLTQVGSRQNRLAAADAASSKEDYQALQDAAEEENKKQGYKAQFKGQDALQTYVYGVNDGDVQEIDDFNNQLIDPNEDMLDRDDVVRIKAETGALWLKEGNFQKGFEANDGDVVSVMFELETPQGKKVLDAKALKKQAKEKQQEDYLMSARPDLYSDAEIAQRAVALIKVGLRNYDNYEYSSNNVYTPGGGMSVGVGVAKGMNETKFLTDAESNILRAYSMIRNSAVLDLVKKELGDDYNKLVEIEETQFNTSNFKNISVEDKSAQSSLSQDEIDYNKYALNYLKSIVADLEREKKANEASEGWKQDFVNYSREIFIGGDTRKSVADKYDLVKSNIYRLEAAAEGRLIGSDGKPVSFEDAMKNLGEVGIQTLEKANQNYMEAQATGEFALDMVTLAIPIP